MTHEIVLAFTPSTNMKDWGLRHDGKWFYEQYVRFYCTECKKNGLHREDVRDVGKEPYYDLLTSKKVEPERLYISERPDNYSFKTVDDVKSSEIYKGENI